MGGGVGEEGGGAADTMKTFNDDEDVGGKSPQVDL